MADYYSAGYDAGTSNQGVWGGESQQWLEGFNDATQDRIERETMTSFDATKQCCWCGSDNTAGTTGYAGEPCCPTCGFGGEGAPDVPCMFYKLTASQREEARPTEPERGAGGLTFSTVTKDTKNIVDRNSAN